MTAIPADIQKAAAAVYAQLGRGPDADEQAIAKALIVERERALDAAYIPLQPYVDALHEGRSAEEVTFNLIMAIRAAIRSPQPSPPKGA